MKVLKPFYLLLFLNSLLLVWSFKPVQSTTVNVTGLWADSNSVNFQHCYIIFSQKDSQLKVAHYLEFNGTPMVEEGEGTVTGNTLNYKVTVTKGIPGWALRGEHHLQLSADGNTLRGFFKDEQGNKGPLVFKKIRP